MQYEKQSHTFYNTNLQTFNKRFTSRTNLIKPSYILLIAMQENNRFIKKFENKRRYNLEGYLETPSIYDPLAVEAAKWLLENKNFEKISEDLEIEKSIPTPVLVEKACFKSKLLYNLTIFFLLIYSLMLLFVSFYQPSFYTIFWALIVASCFIVVISKHKKTVFYLQRLSILALVILVIQYTIYITLSYIYDFELDLKSFISQDYKLVLICLATFYLGDKLVEIRLVPK